MTRRYNTRLLKVVNLPDAMSQNDVIPPIIPERLAKVFKAYDIRGLAPEEFDEPMARALGAAFAKFTQSDAVVIGRDMRPSGEGLSAAFSEGVTSQGVDVTNIGLASTDLLYFASGYLRRPQPC